MLMKKQFQSLTEKGRWLLATLTLIFTLGIGQMWGDDPKLTIANPDQIEYSQDGVYVTSPVVANAKMGNQTNQKCFYVTSSQTTASLNVFSKLTNIKSISFDMVRNTGSSSLGNAISLFVSKGDAYAIPTSTDFTAKRNNSDNVTSLQNVQAIGNNVTNQVTNISVTFTSNVKAIEFRNVYSSGTYVRNLVVTYESGTLPDTYLKATMLTSANDAINMDVEPTGVENASITANTDVSKKAAISEKNYCKMDGTFTINLGTGKTFVAGDQIIVDVCASAAKKQVGITIDSKTINTYLANTIYSQLAYVVKTGDGIIGKQTATFERTSSDTYIHSVSVLRAPAATYSITYHCNGATSGCPSDVTSGATALPNPLPAAPSKTGCEFDKWYTNEGLTVEAEAGATLTADANLYAGWTVNTYSLMWDANGGSITSASNAYTHGTVAYGTTIVAPSVEWDGHDFLGWNVTPAATMPDENVTYTAQWQTAAAKHAISYDNLKGADVSAYPTEYTQGIGIASFAALADTEDEHFLGWSPDHIGTDATTDMTITATWEAKKVVTFNAMGGSSVASQKVASGTTISAPSSTRTNWTLQGWTLDPSAEPVVLYDFSNAITEDLAFTAVWARNTISGASSDVVIINGATINTGGTLSVAHYFSTNSSNGHVKYAGAMKGTGSRFTTFTIPANHTAVVKEATVYTAKTFAIIPESDISGIDFANNTSADATVTYANAYFSLTGASGGKSEDEATVNDAMGAGTYYCGSTGSGLEIGKLTLTVSETPLTVTFKANGTTLYVIPTTTGETLGNMFLNGALPTPSVDGFTFNGWKNGEDAVTASTAVGSTSMVLNADLTPIAYNVTLESNNSKADGAATVHVGDAALMIATAPTAETGYELLGYYTGATNDVLVADASGNLVASVTGYTDENAKWIKAADATLYAQWEDIASVAQIGEAKYTSLEAALEHAADGEIVLIRNINTAAQIEVAAGVTAVIDLAGYKIEYTGTDVLPSGVILVHNGASLTINDSSDPDAGSIVSGDNAYAAIALTKAGDNAANPAVLVINGGALTGYYYGITGNGSRNNTVITINGGTITGTVGIAIYHPQVGTLTVNEGSLTGVDAAIEMRAGTLVINDGTFTATATEFSCNPNGSGSTTSGAAIAIAQHTTKKDISVTINGGTFNGVKALNESNPQVNDPAPQVAMAITNGTFNGAVSTVDVNNFVSGGSFSTPVAESQCAAGYVPETKANGKYGVIEPAQSIDFEAIIDALGTGDEGKAELDAQLTAKHYDIDGTLNDDRLDAGSSKAADKGFKVKKTNLTISFSVEAHKMVEITTGHISGANIKVDAEDAVALATSQTYTYYSDDAQAFLITMTTGSYNIFKSINIRDPYQVTFDYNGGDSPIAPRFGTPSVTLPTSTKGTDHFIGWYDKAAEEGSTLVGLADAVFTPTKDTTLYAHYAPLSNDATLASWEIDGNDTPVPTDPLNLIHRIEVPYGTAVSALPKITAAVAHDATYAQSVVIYPTDGPEWQAGIDGGCYVQQVIVTAEDGTQGFYHVRTKILPKDMLLMIKATHDGTTQGATIEGYFGGDKDKNTQAGGKLGSNDHYFGIKLAEEAGTFQAGDVLKIYASTPSSSVEIFTGKTFSSAADSVAYLNKGTFSNGIYTYTLENATEWLYLYRTKTADKQMNPTLGYMAVYRPFPTPLVNTITFNGAAATVDNDLKTITVEVPASTNLATMPIVANFLSNDPSQTSGAVTGSWAEGDNEYIVTDKDGDQSIYTVTISKAVPSSDATLSALSYGTPATAITLEDGVFEYNVELPYGTSAVPALAATAHHAGASVTNITDAAAFVNRHATSTVTITAEDGTTTQLYTVNFAVSRFESKVLWDGSTMTQMSDITTAAAAAGVSITSADVSVTSFSAITCDENGKSYTKALNFGGKTKSDRYFGIEIPAGKVAKVSLVYKARGNDARSIIIGTAIASAVDESAITSVERENDQTLHIMTADMFGGGTLYINTTNGFHVHEISLQLADGHARSAMLGAGVYGTVCVPNNVAIEDIQGVTVYELMGREPQYGKLAFDEIISGELEAGAPYVFQAHGNHMALLYGTTSVAEPVDKHNGMYGTFEQIVLNDLTDVYYFAQKALWSCDGAIDLTVGANRAYVKLSEIDYLTDPNPAPGRRRVTMAVNGEKVTTDIENFNASEKPVKLLINGQIFILRGEKLFDATGKLVK